MKNFLLLNTEACVSIISGFVKSARWDCKAGMVARCSYVATVLLMLSNCILEIGHVVERTSLIRTDKNITCFTDNVANIFESSIPEQVPGTEEQSKCEIWFQERCLLITASVCKKWGKNKEKS